jgi:hypothetical protein
VGGNNILKHNLHHILNKSGNISSYIELPLNINKQVSKIPHLKIKRIILGYNNDENTYYNLCELIMNVYEPQFNYKIEVDYSKYRE